MIYASRKFVSTIYPGVQSTLYGNNAYAAQLNDTPGRNVLALSDPGKAGADYTQLAAGSSFTLPLPQTYQTGVARLAALILSDQTCKLTIVQPVLGTSNVMLRAGLSLTDQPGVISFCGLVTSLTILNQSATAANLEWMLMELPAIATNAGWRDGPLSTTLVGP